jgi:hypothetical protein
VTYNPFADKPTPDEQYSERSLGDAGIGPHCEFCGGRKRLHISGWGCDDCDGRSGFLPKPLVQPVKVERVYVETNVRHVETDEQREFCRRWKEAEARIAARKAAASK